MSDVVIRIENLSKRFTIGAKKAQYETFRDQIASGLAGIFKSRRRASQAAEGFWALRDVSFEIRRGDVVGLIGRNGAGKSTLLKILSRITEPTSGFADIHGRIASLLEVGTGFHAELSGRENIYLNGAILGMKRTEINRNFDDIVEFAEVGQFVDTPVKHYSSGMYVRLAFAVAAHLQPEILLVDEVLAVGDAAFQRKCLGKMGEVAKDGRTIIFVSHNMAAVEGLCTAAHLISAGQIVQSGSTTEVIASYLSAFATLSGVPLEERPDRRGDRKLVFTDIQLLSEDGTPTAVVQSGKDVEFSVGYKSTDGNIRNVAMSIDIFAQSGQCMIILNNEMIGVDFTSAPAVGRFRCRVGRFPLSPGQYYITLFCSVNGSISDWVQQAAVLTVEAGDFFGSGRLPPPTHGGFLVPQEWHLEDVTTRPVSAAAGTARGPGVRTAPRAQYRRMAHLRVESRVE
jgi:lipopolysaccharide transport system ATP-binding protein